MIYDDKGKPVGVDDEPFAASNRSYRAKMIEDFKRRSIFEPWLYDSDGNPISRLVAGLPRNLDGHWEDEE